MDSGRFDCGIVYRGAMVQLSILPPGDYPGLSGMGFAWVAPSVAVGVVIMVANFDAHYFCISADSTLDRCTCCPFWLVDTTSLETGMCFITGTEIPLDEKPDMERMQDCPIIIRYPIETEEEEMSRAEAISLLEGEIIRCRMAPKINGCPMTEEWQMTIDVCQIAIDAIKAQEAT